MFFLFPYKANKQKWWTPWNVIAFNKKLYYPKCLFLVWANQAVWGCSSLRIGKHMEIHHPTSQATNSLQKYLLGMSPKEIKGTCDILLKGSERYILYTCNLKKCKWMNQDPGRTSQVLFGSTQKTSGPYWAKLQKRPIVALSLTSQKIQSITSTPLQFQFKGSYPCGSVTGNCVVSCDLSAPRFMFLSAKIHNAEQLRICSCAFLYRLRED